MRESGGFTCLHMNLHTHRTRPWLIGIAVVALGATARGQTLDQARSAFAEWARVKTQLSEEQSEWRQEKALITDTLAAARAESTALDERIAEMKASSSESDSKRAGLLAQIEETKAAAAAVAQRVGAAEIALRAMLHLLPPPLMAELQPVLQRLPEDPASTSVPLGQRVQTIAVILAQMDKFNSSFTVVSEIRDLGAGRAVEVKTLYIGLATAYFADATGTTAGYGSPGASGWEWTSADPDLSERIALAIAIQENAQPPAFVALPVQVK